MAERTSEGHKSTAALQEALQDPEVQEATQLAALPRKVYMGVLYKWVNIGKGWRPRFFVLDMQTGVMKYFKVHGFSKVNVEEECKLWSEGNATLELVGEEVQRLRRKAQQFAEEKKQWSYKQPGSQGEVSLQVSTLRESESDHKKFYIHTGTKSLQLRAETRDDRWVWLQALDTSKQQFENAGSHRGVVMRAVDLAQSPLITNVESSLREKGVADDIVDFVVAKMQEQHWHYVDSVGTEREKRRTLLDYVRTLEEEKRELEDQAVVESQQHAKEKSHHALPGSPARSSAGSARSPYRPSSSDADLSRLSVSSGVVGEGRSPQTPTRNGEEAEYSSSGEGGEGSDEEEEDDDQDMFFDCDDEMYPPNYSVQETRTLSYKRIGSFKDASFQADREHPGHSGEPGGAASGGLGHHGTLGSHMSPGGRASFEEGRGIQRVVSVSRPEATPSSPMPSGMEKEVAPVRRDCLPPPVEKERSVSLWSIIKEAVGKDLTRICLPVYFNEPLSALQKACEDMEYSELLDMAASCDPGSDDRLLYVSAFAVSSYSSTEGRTQKPFNPLLGESFEAVYPEKGYRFVSEKVSHHPTIVAAHAEGRGWTFTGETDLRTKFWGRYIEIQPVGLLRVTFADTGEVFTWMKVSTSINNLIIGKLYVDHYGMMKVKNMATGDVCKMKFKEQGFMDKNPHQVKGHVEHKGGRKGRAIWGKWDDALYTDDKEGGGGNLCLWERNPPAEEPTRYNLSRFAITLNELTPGLEEKLPRTDARLRPDQRLLEQGRFTEAFEEKQRLEHKQRAARKMQESGKAPEPAWFTRSGPVEGSGMQEDVFVFNGKYWGARAGSDWQGVRDIFGAT